MPSPLLRTVSAAAPRGNSHHSIVGRYTVAHDGRRLAPWVVMRYTTEERGAELVSCHETEQEAEREVRRLMFPPLPKEFNDGSQDS